MRGKIIIYISSVLLAMSGSCQKEEIDKVEELIFQSGFEPSVSAVQSSDGKSGDLIGKDNSVSTPNDWTDGLENHPNIGNFSIQYEGGSPSIRLAEITPDPQNSANQTLRFWISSPNVPGGSKGRVQGNMYGNSGIKNLYYSIKLFLPRDFNIIKNAPGQLEWLTLMEFWNDPGWTGSKYPFRISVDLQKIGIAPDSLRIGVHGQTKDLSVSFERWQNVWAITNTSFAVPVNQWIELEISIVEGDGSTGRFLMNIISSGLKQEVISVSNFTHHPSNPNPDGFSHFNPFKLYTSDVVINYVSNQGGLLHVYWDDFELWKNKR